MSRSYFVRTYGCQMNEHDSERLAGLLESDGLVAAPSEDEADVIVLNTCCIRENADNKLYGALGHLKSRKESRPGLEIVVAGCLAQKDAEVVRQRAPHVDVVLGTHNVHRAADLLRQARAGGPVTEIWAAADRLDPGHDRTDADRTDADRTDADRTDADRTDADLFPSALPARREVPYAAWVTIQIGCDNSCAFCIVPAVRGPEASRPFGGVVAEVERLAADGVVEVTLLGQNVNSYGRDLTLARRAAPADPQQDAAVAGEGWAADPSRRPRPLFADLLRAVAAVPGIERVRFTSPHPKDLRPDTIAAMAEVPEVCPHLHLPLQSGSDRTLAAMHRGYTADRYLDRLAAARAAVPDLAVTTDLIVGFPGETEDDLVKTLEVVAEAGYDSAFTFVYSPRPGTAAADRADDFVPATVAAERMERLRAVVDRSSLQRHQARVGGVERALVEGPSRKDASRVTARTGQNKLVHLVPDRPLRPGTFVDVAITDAGHHHLLGDLVAVTAPPRHRTRIPVAVTA